MVVERPARSQVRQYERLSRVKAFFHEETSSLVNWRRLNRVRKTEPESGALLYLEHYQDGSLKS